jgi:thiol-disulfide isomerase/thioredoxin
MNFKSFILLLLISLETDAFVPQERGSVAQNNALNSVAGAPIEKGEKRTKDKEDWIPSIYGGFIPKIKEGIRRRSLLQISNIEQYKTEVVQVKDRLVVVRFYAPWCRACRAIEQRFLRLSVEFPQVKFVELPLNRENAFLHEGLGVPTLPFCHLYDPTVGLVEERKINKNLFQEFRGVLQTYVEGQCFVDYVESGRGNLWLGPKE